MGSILIVHYLTFSSVETFKQCGYKLYGHMSFLLFKGFQRSPGFSPCRSVDGALAYMITLNKLGVIVNIKKNTINTMLNQKNLFR